MKKESIDIQPGAQMWHVRDCLTLRVTVSEKRTERIYDVTWCCAGFAPHNSVAFVDELFANELEAVEAALADAQERVESLTWRLDRLNRNT